MSANEGQAQTGATLASRSSDRSTAGRGRTEKSRDTMTDHPRWDELYRCLSEEERTRFFQLACEQGVVPGDQIPSPSPEALHNARSRLQSLLNGHSPHLPPTAMASTVQFFDAELDAEQQKAVLKGVTTPDILLVQGLPGTGKSRVIVELIRQITARGERALLVAPGTAALDRVLALAGHQEGICAIRCTSPEEPGALVEEVKSLTLEEREKQIREQTLRKAQQTVKALEKATAGTDSARKVEEALRKLVACQEDLEARQQAVSQGRERAEEEWQKEISELEANSTAETPFQKELIHCLKKKNETVGKLEKHLRSATKRLEERQAEREKVEQNVSALQPLVEARSQSRWWTPSFWKARFQTERLSHHDKLIQELEALQQEEREQQKEVERLEEELQEKQKESEEKHQAILAREKQRRDKELRQENTELEQEGALIQRQWVEACALLDADLPRPEAISAAGLDEARSKWGTDQKKSEERLRHARRWVESLKESMKAIPGRLSRLANVVAATPAALKEHPHFGEKARPTASFDVLIVDEAERMSLEELNALARRCRRWVLFGEPLRSKERASVLQQLWDRLHDDPRQLPIRWTVQDERLCCQLVPLTDKQRQYTENEPVADREDVELCILAPPEDDPCLAEVYFPHGTSIQEAKEYLFKELEEITCQVSGEQLCWQENDTQLSLRFGNGTAGEEVSVSLGNGVTEQVYEDRSAAVPFETRGFRFSREAGWTRARAEDWVSEHLKLRSYQRTVSLSCLHRMPNELAGFVEQLMEEREPDAIEVAPPLDRAWKQWASSVGFVSVPAMAQSANAEASPEEGGELDLSDEKDREKLPQELRSVLPNRGIVNFEEARAIVKAIEGLLSDPVFRADALQWQQKARLVFPAEQGAERITKKPVRSICSPTIAVTALYPTQAQLIQHLLRQSRNLAAGPDTHLRVAPAKPECSHRTDFFAVLESPEGALSIEVDVPEVLRQRECFVLLLGLTRSHSQKAVCLGEKPETLSLALTRPAGRLLLVGDWRTMARCLEASKPKEPDPGTSDALAARLIRYLHRQGEQAILDF